MRMWVGMLTAGLLVLAGCGDSTETAGGDGSSAAGSPTPATQFEVTPADGARAVAADSPVKVQAVGGPLSEVRVTDGKGSELEGAYSPDRASWTATQPLKVGTRYRVHAWGDGEDGQQVENTTGFTTKDVARSGTLEVANVMPEDGDKVGIGHPLQVTFNQPVTDRATVQNALQVSTTPPVEGAWYWIDDVTVDYRPQAFWPANTTVKLRAKLAGINAGDNIIGGKNLNSGFTVGRAQTIQVDVDKHRLQVLQGKRVLKTYDVSTGKKNWETRNGTKVIMAKEGQHTWTNEAIDAKKEYRYKSKYAMRITNSGEFLHDAPWNAGNIGETNTSHGCVGLLPKDQKWLYQNSMVGDPVVVVGSPKPFGDLTNRIADWNIPWEQWKAGNVDQSGGA